MSSKGVPDDLDLYADGQQNYQPHESVAQTEPEAQPVAETEAADNQQVADDQPQSQQVEEPAAVEPAQPVPTETVATPHADPPKPRADPPKPRVEQKQPQKDEKPQKKTTNNNNNNNNNNVTADGKRDYSKSPAELAYPEKVFDSNCTICYRDISCKLSLPKDANEVKNNFTPVVQVVKAIGTCGESCQGKDFYRIKDASGIIRPGTMTLVLSGPGQGKSSFLRLLSNRIPLTSGTVAYNGRTFDQAAEEGCDLRKMTQYVDQVDTHLPLLTVHETLDFAHQLTSVNYDPQRVEDAITLLGLEECRNTILGNALIRGVSGGQKKRVTIGELLVSDASTLFLDEFSNGLDSSTSTDIGVGLKKFCLKYNSSVVATLQQPTPELFALFDRIIILNEGQVIFDGPLVDAIPFFEGLGFHQPDDIDTSDFIIDCLSQPRSVILRQKEEELFRQKSGKKPKKQPKEIKTSYGPIKPSPTPCITTEEMIEYYHTTPFWQEIKDELDHKIPHQDESGHSEPMDLSKFAPLMPTEDSKTMYKLGYRLPIPTLLGRVTLRQAKIFTRNTQTMIPRIIMAFFMSLIYGSLYYGIETEEYVLRLAAFCIGVSQVAFGNFVEIPISCQAVLVIKKQLAARFYPAWTYSAAALIMSVPMSFVEATVYSLFLYFMTNSYAQPAEFFTFWVLCLICSLQLSTWFRFLAAVGGDEATAQSMAGPSTGVFMVFGGLFVSRSNVPNFMIWLYWISPFSWVVRALSNNEFLSPRYDELIEVSPGVFERLGNRYLATIDIYVGSEWILWCCLFLIGLALLTVCFDQFLLKSKFYEESIGTRRSDEAEIVDGDLDADTGAQAQVDNDDGMLQEQVRAAALHQAEIQAETSHTGSTAQSSTGASHTGSSAAQSSFNPNSLKTLRENLPFAPAWLSFSDVSYTVKVEKDKQMVDRILLNHVNGIAQPGRMLALMGASGAGKTTLLDVLAGLKNTGVVEGKILINGQPTTPELIATMTGYVEQFDTLFPFETVRETLDFAARLRLPHSISYEIKTKIVDEIIDILDLGSMSNFIIGNAKIQGLSPAQRKRVSIGVELVANPSILFLDEPTTGLDSKSAQTVIKVVKRIARSGRAVICTIHQPNSELFFMFDRLLLLGAGGFQIYYGDVGRRAKTFIDYLSRCPGVTPIQPRVNPASWMLVELGVGVASEKGDIEAGRANVAKRDDTFEVQDEPEWADMEPSKVTVQRFKKIYLQSDHFKMCEKRLRVLESIEIIDPTDSAGLERHRKEVEMATVQRTNNKGVAKSTDSGATTELSANTSKTTLPTTTIVIQRATRPPWYVQLKLLFARNFSAYFRNGSFIYARLSVITILSILFGLIYLDLTAVDVASATSLIGATFMGNIFSAITHCSTAIPTFFEQRPTFYREKAAGYYYPALWAACQLGIELVYMFFGLIVTQIPVYFLVGLDRDAGIFFSYSLATYLLFMVYVTVAMWLSSIAPNSGAAGVIVGAYMSFQSAVSGIAITLPNIPEGYKWLYYGLPGSHLFRAIIMPQFKNNDSEMEFVDGTTITTIPVKEYVANYLGWDYDGYWTALGWALLFVVVLQVISWLATAYLAFNKR